MRANGSGWPPTRRETLAVVFVAVAVVLAIGFFFVVAQIAV